MINKFKLFIIFTLLSFLPSFIFASDSGKKTIKIASGGIMKSYYEVALKLCQFFEKAIPDSTCEVIETSGSKENLKLLKDNEVNFAFTQSDIAMQAFSGIDEYDTPRLELRQVLKLYDEVFTIITKDDDKIKYFGDIAGQRITNGPEDSGSSVTYNVVKALYEFQQPIDLDINPEQYANKLCAGDIEAVILVVGHPNKIVNLISNKCNVEFVTIEAEKLTRLLQHNKAYKQVTLLKDTYPGISEDQQTVGVSAILVTNANTDSDIIENFMNYFNSHITEFKQSNFMLENLSDKHFTSDFVLPVHEKLMKKN